jgi:pimeloyl-ACP methyl ester carboxylesterase
LDLRDFILVGHSNGALAALSYAAFREPKPRRLIYVDVAPSVPEHQVSYFRQRAGAVARPFAALDKLVAGMAAIDPTVPVATFTDYVAGLVTPIDGGVKLGFDAETYGSWQPANLWDALAGLACPLTIVRGSESQVLNEADAERMRRVRPEARFAVVDGAGHFLMLTVPERVAAIILDASS